MSDEKPQKCTSQVKLCDHLQFSHRKRAKPCDYSIRTNFNSCTENFYIDGFHVPNTYTGNIEHSNIEYTIHININGKNNGNLTINQ